jgi:hypothetical protein
MSIYISQVFVSIDIPKLVWFHNEEMRCDVLPQLSQGASHFSSGYSRHRGAFCEKLTRLLRCSTPSCPLFGGISCCAGWSIMHEHRAPPHSDSDDKSPSRAYSNEGAKVHKDFGVHSHPFRWRLPANQVKNSAPQVVTHP